MKKLLIMAAVIVAGVTVNAASFKWSAANVYGASGDKFTGNATIYAYASDATLADAVSVTTLAVTSGAMAGTYDWEAAVAGTTYNFYFVIEDGGKVFNSATSNPAVIKSGVANVSTTTTVGFANMTTATKTNAASNWAAVPEPTSGLMLLLGVAGLALKRKRA